MLILGISFGYHDSSVCVIKDDEVLFASSEERFNRIKHDSVFPSLAMDYAMKKLGFVAGDISKVVYYENPTAKLERILRSSCLKNDYDYFYEVVSNWMDKKAFDPVSIICEKLGVEAEVVTELEHHLSHASSAFYCSGFEKSAVLTIDGVGEFESATIWLGDGNALEKIESFRLPFSVGLLYSAITAFLGFEVNEGEYKVMGMAPYGKPIYKEKLRAIFDFAEKPFVDEEYFEFITPKHSMFTDKLTELLGKSRGKDVLFFTQEHGEFEEFSKEYDEETAKANSYYADIASSLQSLTEEIVVKFAQTAIQKCGVNKLCFAGGVALNSVANQKISSSIDLDGFYIHPASGDSGSAVGCAMHYYRQNGGQNKGASLVSPYLGASYGREDILEVIKNNCIESFLEFKNDEDLVDFVSDRLMEKCVCGWFNGAAEWGPRALGNRSIIASPVFADMKAIVNAKIKFREPYRPFAPSVLAECAHEWFDVDPKKLSPYAPESFMLKVAPVKKGMEGNIPAVTHVDGSARIQTVYEQTNPLYYKLIKRFSQKSGVPIILNTSFNLKGEPVVNTPKDALVTFSFSEMDYLIMPPFVIKSYWGQHE